MMIGVEGTVPTSSIEEDDISTLEIKGVAARASASGVWC